MAESSPSARLMPAVGAFLAAATSRSGEPESSGRRRANSIAGFAPRAASSTTASPAPSRLAMQRRAASSAGDGNASAASTSRASPRWPRSMVGRLQPDGGERLDAQRDHLGVAVRAGQAGQLDAGLGELALAARGAIEAHDRPFVAETHRPLLDRESGWR